LKEKDRRRRKGGVDKDRKEKGEEGVGYRKREWGRKEMRPGENLGVSRGWGLS
jgi:hypothetical protein